VYPPPAVAEKQVREATTARLATLKDRIFADAVDAQALADVWEDTKKSI